MARSYDALVVGGGPAGSAAAITLARRGARVLIIDRRAFPRDKVCGGLLTNKAVALLQDALSVDPRATNHFTTRGFELYSRNVLLNRAYGLHDLLFVPRSSFDHQLLSTALDLGCHFHQAHLPQLPEGHALDLPQCAVTFNYIIGAFGASSTIAASPNRRRCTATRADAAVRSRTAFGMQARVPASLLYDRADALPRVYFGYTRCGWAWVFPHGDTAEVGIGGIGLHHQARQHLREFCSSIGLRDLSLLAHARGAWIPYGMFLTRPASANTLLVGDAAGFVEPITGEGIYYALLSGYLAAIAIVEHNHSAPDAYISACHDQILPELRSARRLRPLLFNRWLAPISLACIRRDARHMRRYLRLLAGDISYRGYFMRFFDHHDS